MSRDKEVLDMLSIGVHPIEICDRLGLGSTQAVINVIKRNSVDPDDWRRVCHQPVLEMYKSGTGVRDIAAAYGVKGKSIWTTLHLNDTRRKSPDISKISDEDVTAVLDSSDTVMEAAEVLNVSRSTVAAKAKELGHTFRSDDDRKCSLNGSIFKKIDTEEKAYWLGFMYADGHVLFDRPDVGLALGVKDKAHVYKFAAFLGCEPEKVKTYKNQTSYGSSECVQITVRSKEMVLDLAKHGCLPRKSFDLQPPTTVPKNLVRHFIRGVCDGGGYISKNIKAASVEIVGSHSLLNWIKGEGPEGFTGPTQHKSIYRIRTSGASVQEWVEYMYKDATVFLDRKAKIAEEYFRVK